MFLRHAGLAAARVVAMELAEAGTPIGRGCMMARITHVHTIDEAARRIRENLELIEIVSANSDNINYGEMIWVDDGTEEGICFAARVRRTFPTSIRIRAGATISAAWKSSALSLSSSSTIHLIATEVSTTKRRLSNIKLRLDSDPRAGCRSRRGSLERASRAWHEPRRRSQICARGGGLPQGSCDARPLRIAPPSLPAP